MGKKTKVITFRTEEWIKDRIDKIASQNKWSPAQTVEEIIKLFIANPHPGIITVKTSDLVNVVKELERENINGATRLTISIQTNEDETDLEKTLDFDALECGGLGCISGFQTIIEISQEELLNIP